LLAVVSAARGAEAACNATCLRDVARCMATQCEGISQPTWRRRCKPPAIRTLAYALSECRQDAAGFMVMRQELRIRRGDRDPITVMERLMGVIPLRDATARAGSSDPPSRAAIGRWAMIMTRKETDDAA
jgi:hypothetical protein